MDGQPWGVVCIKTPAQESACMCSLELSAQVVWPYKELTGHMPQQMHDWKCSLGERALEPKWGEEPYEPRVQAVSFTATKKVMM